MAVRLFVAVLLVAVAHAEHVVSRNAQRVRRELRDLPKAEFDAIVNAMWIMKKLSPAEGEAKYGKHFRTYDSFVAQHIEASLSSECDNAHFTPVFAVWHLAYLAQFDAADPPATFASDGAYLAQFDAADFLSSYWSEQLAGPH